MTLVTKAQAFGRLLGRGGRRMQGLRAYFAKRGDHLAQKGVQVRSPGHLRLGVESRLKQYEAIDENIAHLIGGGDVRVPSPTGYPHLPKTPALRSAQDWQYGVGALTLNKAGRRRRVAKEIREYRKEHGAKATRRRLQQIGLEYRKHRAPEAPTSPSLKRIAT